MLGWSLKTLLTYHLLAYLADLASNLTLASKWWDYNTAIQRPQRRLQWAKRKRGWSQLVLYFSLLQLSRTSRDNKPGSNWRCLNTGFVPSGGALQETVQYVRLKPSVRSACNRLASHSVRTTTARTPSSSVNTWCYEYCFDPEKVFISHLLSTQVYSLVFPRCLSQALALSFSFPPSSSCCKLGCLPPPYWSPSPSRPVNLAQPCPAPIGQITLCYWPSQPPVIRPPRVLIGRSVHWNASHMQISPGFTISDPTRHKNKTLFLETLLINKMIYKDLIIPHVNTHK